MIEQDTASILHGSELQKSDENSNKKKLKYLVLHIHNNKSVITIMLYYHNYCVLDYV
jgi:hypothetical protein